MIAIPSRVHIAPTACKPRPCAEVHIESHNVMAAVNTDGTSGRMVSFAGLRMEKSRTSYGKAYSSGIAIRAISPLTQEMSVKIDLQLQESSKDMVPDKLNVLPMAHL